MKKKSSDQASDDKKQPPAFIKDKMDKKSADDEDDCNKAMGDADGDDDDDDDGDEDDEKMSKKAKKSLTPATLRKSMEILNALAEQSSETREQALARKISKGNISRAERAEFAELMSKSQDEAAETAGGGDLKKSLESDEHDEYFDAAPYLKENAQLVAKSIDGLAKSLQHIQGNQNQFNTALVKAMANIGEVSAQLLERMSQVENQPARVAKSQVVAEKVQAKALEKSAMNQHEGAAEGNTLSKAATMDVLEQLNKSSLATEHPGFSPNGGSYLAAIAQFENSNYLETGMANEVVQFARAQRAS